MSEASVETQATEADKPWYSIEDGDLYKDIEKAFLMEKTSAKLILTL